MTVAEQLEANRRLAFSRAAVPASLRTLAISEAQERVTALQAEAIDAFLWSRDQTFPPRLRHRLQQHSRYLAYWAEREEQRSKLL